MSEQETQEVKEAKSETLNAKSEEQGVEQEATSKKQEEKPKKDKDIKVKQSEWQHLAEEAKENKDKYLRLFAEFENMRKRNERERTEFVKYANEGLIVEFLDMADNFQRSLAAYEQNKEDTVSLIKGLEMMSKEINKLLEKNQVKAMEIKPGTTFDPNSQEILMQEETDEYEDGAVIEVYQTGYMLGDRIVRTAKVKVATNKK